MVSKLANTPWPKGSFTETSNLWPQEWFCITEPRGTKWAATPAFRSGPPLWLTSWINKGLDWGSIDEVRTLQSRIHSLIEKDTGLINVIQVMLVHRFLPCQRWPLRMWEFNQRDHEPFSTSPARHSEECGNYSSGHENSGRILQRTSALTATIRIHR